jgi:hypothetical protein
LVLLQYRVGEAGRVKKRQRRQTLQAVRDRVNRVAVDDFSGEDVSRRCGDL